MIYHTFAHTMPAAYRLLPDRMQSPEATALVLAIGLQESRFEARRQLPKGPARGFWQFERGGGVVGVLTHGTTRPHAAKVLDFLRYPADIDSHGVHTAIEHNDVLACCFARLLLWTLPDRLPGRLDVDLGWNQYLRAWRPGKPHITTWPENYAIAWELVEPHASI